MSFQLLPSMSLGLRLSLLLVAWLIVLGGGLVWIRLAFRPRDGEAADRCGGCGYAVRTLSNFICPECGSDMREVGVLPAKDGKTMKRRYLQFFAISLLALVIAFFITG